MSGVCAWGAEMRGQAGFFDIDERLRELSAKGDSLGRLSAVIDFETVSGGSGAGGAALGAMQQMVWLAAQTAQT